ncbi:hypothetical protein ABZ855_07830, partial [Streptomyces sp. NPDC047042]
LRPDPAWGCAPTPPGAAPRPRPGLRPDPARGCAPDPARGLRWVYGRTYVRAAMGVMGALGWPIGRATMRT